MEPKFIGIDIGGTKTAWGIFNQKGKLLTSDQKPTPKEKDEFLSLLKEIISPENVESIGIGIAGTVSTDHKDTIS